MLRHTVYLILASILAIFFIKELATFLHYVAKFYYYVSDLLTHIFSGGYIGKLIRQIGSLAFIPIVIGLIPGGIYWVINRKEMPYLYYVFWILWIMLTTTIVLHR